MVTQSNYFGKNNPFMDFLETEPAAAYYSSPGGQAFRGGSQGQQRYFQNQFQDIYNEFLGGLGQQIRAGQVPTMRWAEYLENVPFTERYAALSPEQAGRSRRRYSPSTRQIYF
jgi:hypothetical protein|tara:strand:- start:1076 stop:1414 length:339 start_codon:yes stop_codon:yes gene_type:complete